VRMLVCLLAAALGLGAFALPAEAAGSCSVRDHEIRGVAHSRVLITRGPVVVYRVRHRAFDTYWGCTRGGRAAILMGRDDRYAMRNELYGPTTAFGEIRVAGEWITAIHEQDNDPECGKYGEEGCEGRSTTLVVVNVALRLVAHENVYFPVSETAAWLVSPQGGIAWLEESLQDELDGCAAQALGGRLVCPERMLGSGRIPSSSLHLSGTTLTWTASDGPHSATL
jgi:hypothetical protein